MNEVRQVPKPSVLAERGLLPPEAADCATALAAERRRPERCKNRDQGLKREPFPCLINSAGSSTYPARKSVRRTRATPDHHAILAGPVADVVAREQQIRAPDCPQRSPSGVTHTVVRVGRCTDDPCALRPIIDLK